MASVRQTHDSPKLKSDKTSVSAEYTYHVVGWESESLALTQLIAAVPAAVSINGVLCPIDDLSLDHESFGVYLGTANYKSPDKKEESEEPPPDLAYAVSVETGGGTIQLNKSLETKQIRSAAGDEALDLFGSLIGVTPDGVEGVEIGDPIFRWTETIEIPIAQWTGAFIRKLAAATKKTNSVTFRGFAVGEILLEAVSGSTTEGFTKASINFSFAHSENVTDLTVGDITGINKKGWEYLWIAYEDATETVGSSDKLVVKKPRLVCVEQVYKSTNFITELGLPGS